MVGYLGHVAAGLLFAVPAWFLWDGRTSLAFVGFVVSTSLLPDVDTQIPGVAHHGVTHTFVFVTAVAVVVGGLVAAAANPILRRWWRRSEGHPAGEAEVYVFVIGGLLLGGVSHLFADMVSHPDGVPPVEPFWPFFTKPFEVDLIYYGDPTWNVGLLAVAAVVHLLLLSVDAGPTWFGPAAHDRKSR